LVYEVLVLSSITGLLFSADLSRKELTKYDVMGVDEILRGQPYGDYYTITDQARIKVEKYGVNYRLMILAVLMHRRLAEGRRIDARLKRVKDKFGDAATAVAEFFGPDEPKPAREWAGRGVRTRLTQDPIDDGGHAWVDNALAEMGVEAKPVDDSWADVDVRDGVYGPKTGGLLRRIVDSHGNWTEIRSFGG